MYIILTTVLKITALHLRSIFFPVDEHAQLHWDTVFVPSKRLRTNQYLMNRAFQLGFENAQAGLFGFQANRQDVIDNAHYPQPEDI